MPSPMYSSARYTLFTPGQAVSNLTAGWDMAYPASQIAWQPHPCAPSCIQTAGITNLDQWIDWVYCNLIRLFCDWANNRCNILVGGDLMTVGAAIADCINLTTEKNTIVYDTAGKIAVAGSVISEADCFLFMNGAYDCISHAVPDDKHPRQVLGRVQNNGGYAKKYAFSSNKPTDIRKHVTSNSLENNTTNVIAGQRLVPIALGTINDTPNEGNIYTESTGEITVNNEGFYRFGITNFVDLTYTAKSNAKSLCHVLAGYMTEDPLTKARSEVRTFQTPIWREYGTRQRLVVKWNTSSWIKAGTKITPRVWLTMEDNDPISVNLAAYDPLAQLYIQRIPNQSLNH